MADTISIVALMQVGGAVFTLGKGVFDLIVGFSERRKTENYQHHTQATLQDIQKHQQQTEATLREVQRTQLANWNDLWATIEKGRLLQEQRHQQVTATQQLMLTMLLFTSTLLVYHHLSQHQPFIGVHQDILSILFLASSSCYVFYSSRWSQVASITLGAVLVGKPLVVQWLWLSKYSSAIFIASLLAGIVAGVASENGNQGFLLVMGANQPMCALLSSVQLYHLLAALGDTRFSLSIFGAA